MKRVFEKGKDTRGDDLPAVNTNTVENSLDTETLDRLLESKDEMARCVYKQTISRPDVDLKDHAASVSAFLGFNTRAVQGTIDKAAVVGDFAMLEHDAAPVIQSLVENGPEVVELCTITWFMKSLVYSFTLLGSGTCGEVGTRSTGSTGPNLNILF